MTAQPADGAVAAPVVLLVDQGTAGAAEVFAAALDGNKRAELVGEHTLGRAARQRLVKLPDGSGLLLSNLRYLTPANDADPREGPEPDVEVEQPDVEFGAEPPAGDPTLDSARSSSLSAEQEGGLTDRSRPPSFPARQFVILSVRVNA